MFINLILLGIYLSMLLMVVIIIGKDFIEKIRNCAFAYVLL
jgi:hypothetical protein